MAEGWAVEVLAKEPTAAVMRAVALRDREGALAVVLEVTATAGEVEAAVRAKVLRARARAAREREMAVVAREPVAVARAWAARVRAAAAAASEEAGRDWATKATGRG